MCGSTLKNHVCSSVHVKPMSKADHATTPILQCSPYICIWIPVVLTVSDNVERPDQGEVACKSILRKER